LRTALVRNPEQDVSRELHREAREWQGDAIAGLAEALHLLKR
jgi:hypothetical protein